MSDKPDDYVYSHDDSLESVGRAVVILQSYIHKLKNPKFTEELEKAAKIFEMWLMHPKGRNWNLIRDVNNLTGGNPK